MKTLKIFSLVFLFIFISYVIYANLTIRDKDFEVVIEDRGVFISYLDYGPLLKGKTKEEQEILIDEMIDNIASFNLNLVFLQVRPFSDAIYNSKIFLSSRVVVKNEGDTLAVDILEYFIEKAHVKNIKVHAWINPYRIRSTNDIESISKKNSYYSFFETDGIQITDSGIYFNPASNEVRDFIISGIEELVVNYDIDGILYDDYFYPNKTIDLKNYDSYIESGGTLSISEYRVNNINQLIFETYNIIKKHKKEVLFGISPAGNINNNLNQEYLDVAYLLSESNYIDYIMPQIYYGFENEHLPFIDTVELWSSMISNDSKLYIALALYKSGLEDKYAGTGKYEWVNNNDIIKKQILTSRLNEKYKGFGIFRYNYLFNENKSINLLEEVNNLEVIL